MRRAVTALVSFGVLLCLLSMAFALDGKKAMHVGGSLASRVPAETEGVINTSYEEKLIFIADKSFATIEIPYATIETLEYGQKASRHLLTPWKLFSKKRRHFLSVVYRDKDNKDQAVVFELGNDILRPTVLVLEARSHKKLVFQDDEAREHYAK
jgi:hypothetical protein